MSSRHWQSGLENPSWVRFALCAQGIRAQLSFADLIFSEDQLVFVGRRHGLGASSSLPRYNIQAVLVADMQVRAWIPVKSMMGVFIFPCELLVKGFRGC